MNNQTAEIVDDIKSKIQFLKKQKTLMKQNTASIQENLNFEINKDTLKQFKKSS
jgi:hypothetical protein